MLEKRGDPVEATTLDIDTVGTTTALLLAGGSDLGAAAAAADDTAS